MALEASVRWPTNARNLAQTLASGMNDRPTLTKYLTESSRSGRRFSCNLAQVFVCIALPSPEPVLSAKRVLLIIGGGIAAYKSLELIRLLAKQGIATRAILTKAGAEFVTPLSVAALSGEKVFTDLFSLTDEAEMGHIELSRSADLVVVCPATADLIAKAANGLANDLASTALLATDKPVLMAPAMNVRMWGHAATQRNVLRLKADGVCVMQPDEGPMACGEFGPGRLPEPERIAAEIHWLLGHASDGPLHGLRAVVTAGPTREPLDPVRFISNYSTGVMGKYLVEAAKKRGHAVEWIKCPEKAKTALDLQKKLNSLLHKNDVLIMAAAVSDVRPASLSSDKIKKDKNWH